ncbi:MAG: glycosyltransferase [Candidatus Bathyarchaeota archaeon]|nr:glycosyltransferase [Candidatus Bathyarchaeum tardum]WGM90013.1 MAG: glycosyltransferase [Candidatus Bathyarchaeum tardum]
MKNKATNNTELGVSIIVTTLNSAQTLDECLQSIFELDYPKELLEVIVVDGGSTDATIEIAKKYSVKLVYSQLNPAAAYNLVLDDAKHEVIGLIDSDAKVEKQWLTKLANLLDDTKIAGASGTVETWNKNNLVPRVIGYELNYRYRRLPKSVERVATMNLLLKKQIVKKIGGFDETLPTQYDTDIGARLAKEGYTIAFDSEAVCYHFHRPTLGAFFRQQYKYGQNTWKLYLKHPKLAKGDKITDGWMNAQPILYGIAGILLLVSFVTIFHWIPSFAFLGIVTVTLLQYVASATKISSIYRDGSAMYLVVIYFVRALGWTLGGITSLIQIALTREEDKH